MLLNSGGGILKMGGGGILIMSGGGKHISYCGGGGDVQKYRNYKQKEESSGTNGKKVFSGRQPDIQIEDVSLSGDYQERRES